MSRGETILGRCEVKAEPAPGPAFHANPPEGQQGPPKTRDLRVLHLKQARFPHLRFEYHPVAKRVYVIRLDVPQGESPLAECFAWEVKDEGVAWNVTLTWLRGYQHGKAEKALSPAEQQERSEYAELG